MFREIWYPVELRPTEQPGPKHVPMESQKGGVQLYQQVTGGSSFAWNAVVSVTSLDIQLDLGQGVGKSSLLISSFWATSKKESAFEQNLCMGFDNIGVQSKGRMSGNIRLQSFRLTSNILWSTQSTALAPLVQASLSFNDFRIKAAFDYQTFAIAEVSGLHFLLYNVSQTGSDRLLCTVNGDKVHVYLTANAGAQGIALYQALDRLVQERQAAYQTSLRDIEKFQARRRSTVMSPASRTHVPGSTMQETERAPDRLQVNVVVSLNAVKVGAYPRSFTDTSIFKLEAFDTGTRFGVVLRDGKVQTILNLVLGQVRVALSNVSRNGSQAKTLGDVSIEEVIKDSIDSRGGTILKVPRVVATMNTWQASHSKQVEYIFLSTFEGKVEVGWNYSRISFIRTMWDIHSKAIVQRLGKPLPQSAVQITSISGPEVDTKGEGGNEGHDKITAVVHVPLSKYTYLAREPPVIQTPQLRDMGEATPPLEWIGLQRDKLPNLTHQIVIVPLLELAKEVEDAYLKILGSS